MDRTILNKFMVLRAIDLRKVFFVSSAAAAVVLFSGLVMFDLARPAVSKSQSAEVSVAANDAAKAAAAVPAPILGINIANNGLVSIKGAKIVAIWSDNLDVSIAWGSTNFIWKIAIGPVTKIFDESGKRQNYSDLKVGDIISATGQLAGNENNPIIKAEFVRN